MPVSRMLNIGCGSHYHPDWINLDVSPVDSQVLPVDINKGLPFPAASAEVCYSSHVLEHLDRQGASHFVNECFRVLRPGGTIRLVLPDLEALAREYLKVLDVVASGDKTRELDYEWLMLELVDQMVRTYSGGEMAHFLKDIDEKAKPFVRSRIGDEAEQFWRLREHASAGLPGLMKKISSMRLLSYAREKLAGWLVYLVAGSAARRSFHAGMFRDRGEVHRWMYDRYSLRQLLNKAGFVDIRLCAANESRIPEYGTYALDVLDLTVRKPDSLYIEASKP